MTRLIVAGGGGGDAVAAAVLDRALYGRGAGDDRALYGRGAGDDRAVVLTYAWDRLLVDPVPGPRAAADFTGLRALTPNVYAVPADGKPVAPAGSTLPRLAAELPHTFALLDPHHGVEGMVRQLEELIEHLAPASVDLLDVGGDILAHGDEPTLRSPLGDALSLAACAQVNAEIRLLVAGPGLDGELPVEVLHERLERVVHTLTAGDVAPIGPVMEWHPSEATGMLTAAARGVRGLCEVRDAGLTIPLTDDGAVVHEADLDTAFRRNRLAGAIADTTGLAEAEWHCREICGYSEIDYEREKAARSGAAPEGPFRPRAVLAGVTRFAEEARARGVSHTTFRRLTEVLGLNGVQRADLRALLIGTQPERYDAPLWRL